MKTVHLPDGSTADFPDNMDNAAIESALAQHFGLGQQNAQNSAPVDKPSAFSVDNIMQQAGNVLAGGVRGAGSIGSTIISALDDPVNNMAAGKPIFSREADKQRRAGMDSGLQTMGAQPDSLAFKGGKLGAEIAGTMPIGGLLGKAVAPVAPALGEAIGSGGFSLGNAATDSAITNGLLRAGGGAINGAATAGAIDPSTAGEGAALGAVLPGAVQLAGGAGTAIRKGVSGLLSNTLGATTGAGSEAVKAAYQAGKDGSTAFLDNMRGNAEFGDIVDTAKQGLANMRAERGAAYRSGMVDIKNDASVLDYTPIQAAMNKVADMGSFKGVAINKNASGIVDDLKNTVEQWAALNPAEYHTPEGLDALKQSIGDIRDSTQFGTPARRAADQVYHAVKDQITTQAPTYAKVMKDYSSASDSLNEITKALSLGDKTSKDTAIRKLQSLLRNNASTNYGNRLSLASQLETAGGVDLTPAIAGQAMSSFMPRGMSGAVEKAGIIPTALLAPKALLAAPFTSPRAVGEMSYLFGRGAGGVQSLGKPVTGAMNGLLSQQAAMNPLLRSMPLGLLAAQRSQQ